jgi:hypothetical protein
LCAVLFSLPRVSRHNTQREFHTFCTQNKLRHICFIIVFLYFCISRAHSQKASEECKHQRRLCCQWTWFKWSRCLRFRLRLHVSEVMFCYHHLPWSSSLCVYFDYFRFRLALRAIRRISIISCTIWEGIIWLKGLR